MVPNDQALDAELQDSTPAALDDVFETLADEKRRFALYYLRENPRSSVDELADALAGWLSVDNRPLATPRRRDEIRVSLDRAHLPKLEDRS